MLVKVFFGNQLPPERFKNHLKRWRQYYLDLLEKYETEVMPVIQRQSTKAGFSEDSIYWNLSLDFGRRQARMVIEWCDQALRDLEGKKRKKK
jgi:DNA topoisomerase VI subunit A